MQVKKWITRMQRLCLVSIMIAGGTGIWAAESMPCQLKELENGRLRLENQYVLLEVAPASGGRGSRLTYKTAARELAFFGPDAGSPWGGLFGDRLVENGKASSDALSAPYTYEIKLNSPEVVSVALHYKGGDNLLFEKAITLQRGRSSIGILRSMIYAAADPNAPKKKAGLWSHESLRAGLAEDQRAYSNVFFIPTGKGILKVPFIPDLVNNAPGTDKGYVRDPARGWVAVAGGESQAKAFGAAYEVDFTSLDFIYLYHNKGAQKMPTLEWATFEREIKDGDRLDVETRLIPFNGLSEVSGVGNGIIGNIAIPSEIKDPSAILPVNISLYSDASREGRLVVSLRRLPDGTGTTNWNKTISLQVDQTVSVDTAFTPSATGTYVIAARVEDQAGKALMEMEKPLQIGAPSGNYLVAPLTRQLPKISPYVRPPLAGPASPHEKWLKPLAGKNPHLLIFTPVRSVRFLFEMSQRMDFTYDYVFYHNGALLKKDDASYILLQGAGIDRNEEDLLKEYLEKPELNAIVVGGFRLGLLPEALRSQMLERIRGGVGLVLFPVNVKEMDLLGKDLSATDGEGVWPGSAWNLTDAFPFKDFNPGPFRPLLSYQNQGIVWGAKLGQGRVAGLTAASSKLFEMQTRDWAAREYFDLQTGQEFPDFEYSYLLAARMIRWASAFMSEIKISQCDSSAPSIRQGEAAKIKLELENNSKASQDVAVHWELKDPFYRLVIKGELPGQTMGAGAKNELSLLMPSHLVPGKYYLHVFAANKANEIYDSCATPFEVVSPVQIKALLVKNRRYLPEGNVDGQVDVVTDGTNQRRIRLVQELVTPSGRVICRSSRDALLGNGATTLPYSIRVPRTKALILDLHTRIIEGENILAERIDYLVPDNALSTDRTEMTFESFPLRYLEMGRYLGRYLNQENIESGIMESIAFDKDGRMTYPVVDFNSCLAALKSDVKWVFGWNGSVASSPHIGTCKEHRKGPPASWPAATENGPANCWKSIYTGLCYEDPKHIETEAKLIKGFAARFAPLYQPECLWRADEAHLQANAYDGAEPTDDLCFCEHHLKKFRQYLQKEYGTLEALNQSWQTNFPSWDAAVPVAGRQMVGKESIAPFLDFRMFMCRSFADLILRAKPALEAGGLSRTRSNANIHWESPFTCLLAYYIFGTGTQGLITPFYYPRTLDQVRSYAQDAADKSIIIGYDLWGHHYPDEIYAAWKNVLYGGSRISFYGGTDALRLTCVLTPTFEPGSLYNWLKDLREGIKENGVAKIILSARPEPYRVGIVESYRSMMDFYVEPELFDDQGKYKKSTYARWNEWKSIYGCYGQLMEDMGLGWRLINEDEIAQDMIPKGMQVLILPRVTCVSDKLWQGLERFLAQGGIIIADWRLGERDGHGKIAAQGKALQELFGVSRKDLQRETGISLFSVKKSGTFSGSGREKGIQVAGGQALGEYIDGVPALILNDHAGKGQGIYLNFSLLNYTGDYVKARRLFAEFFSKAGIKAPVKLTRANGQDYTGVFSRSFQRGDYSYLGLLSMNSSKDVRVEFPDQRWIYNVGGVDLLGFTNSALVDLKAANGKLLARLPSRVKGVTLTLPGSVKQGETLACQAQVQLESGQAGDHVLLLTVKSPDGKLFSEWSGNRLAEKGALSENWLIALNESPGKWEVTVRDTISGSTATGAFVVKSGASRWQTWLTKWRH